MADHGDGGPDPTDGIDDHRPPAPDGGTDGALGTAADPAADSAAGYDYRGGPVERPDLAAAIEDRIAGEVRFDEYSRQLYATDASAYEVEPVGVVFPTGTADVAAVVSYCAAEGVAVLPRGAGTSLAGQAVNEAVVLDCSRHMDGLVSVDPDAATARAQPGIVLADLNEALAPHGLKFAPDPAWGDKSTLGGAVGNNSSGAHSLVYGTTDAYVESCEVVLADGTVTEFGEVTLAELRERAGDGDVEARFHRAVHRIVTEEADAVREAFPDLDRNVSGYNLDRVVAEAETGSVNLARLLAGSEGTLGVVTAVTVSLEPVPETAATVLVCYDAVGDAVADVAPILDHDPCAVELMDDVLLDLAAESDAFAEQVAILPDGTEAMLLVEFYADDRAGARRQVANLLADRVPDAAPEGTPASPGERPAPDAPARAVAALEAHDDQRREEFWTLRKAGLPILLSRTTDAKHISFVEDTAVPPERLPEFVDRFDAVLDEHDTFASYYGHAGPGVLHVRPLIDTKSVDGVEAMASIGEAVADIAVDLDGAVSGEHGDGRVRTTYNRKRYGDHVMGLFRDLKAAADPQGLLNPGQVCGDLDPTEHLRFDPEYEFDAGFEPSLAWRTENGFQGMVELCHGCGGCRGGQSTTGGVMCPTFRAEDEEILSTRGRANLLRQAMSGDLDADATDEEFLTEVLDLCIGCKGCARDCPSSVDMAKLKVEVEHEHNQRHGPSLRDRLFAHYHDLARVGSATAPVSNWLADAPGAGWLAEQAVGIAASRSLPSFAATPLRDRLRGRTPAVPVEDADRRVLLFPDTDTDYVDPAVGEAAVRVLEAAGVHVRLARQTTGSGRPPHSKGFLGLARRRARRNVAALDPAVRAGWDVVVPEPSDAVMLQSDYRDLLTGDAVDRVAAATYGVCEYLDRFDLEPGARADGSLAYHGHCHQKAAGTTDHAAAVLDAAGYEVNQIDSTCCGMAGTFGYEAEHLSMSRAIRSLLTDQIDRSPAGALVAAGTSCRSQLADAGYEPVHPAVALAGSLE